MRFSLLIKGLAALVLIPAFAYAQGPGAGGGGGGGWRQRGGGRGNWDPGQMFDRFANGKQVWVRSESPNEFSQGFFDRIAQSMNITNGQITREQFTTYMQQQQQNGWGGFGGGRGGRGMRQGQDGSPGAPRGNGSESAPNNGQGNGGNRSDQWAENMFRRLDANGDGLLNYDEMPESLRAERDKWDTNKDGFIDLSEFKAYFQAVVQQRMQENGGWNQNWQGGMPDLGAAPAPEEEEVKKPVVYHAGNLPKDIPDWFKQIDSDGDGQIGLYEWKASGRSMDEFRKIDRNNDGFLTIDEVMRYVADQKKPGGTTPSPGFGMIGGGPGGNQVGRPAFAGGFQGRRNGNRDRGDRSGG